MGHLCLVKPPVLLIILSILVHQSTCLQIKQIKYLLLSTLWLTEYVPHHFRQAERNTAHINKVIYIDDNLKLLHIFLLEYKYPLLIKAYLIPENIYLCN